MKSLVRQPEQRLDFFSLPIEEVVAQIDKIELAYDAEKSAVNTETVVKDRKGALRILKDSLAKETNAEKLAYLRDMIKGSLAAVNRAVLVKTLYRRKAGDLLPTGDKLNKGGRPPENPYPDGRGLPDSYADLGFTNYVVVARLRRLSNVPMTTLLAFCERKTE